MSELTAFALVASFLSFLVSASAGLGGSLVLVPALALALGVKPGIAMAALLLAVNNFFKVVAYRGTIPVGPSLGVLTATVVGAAIGAKMLLWAPETWVRIGVAASIGLTLCFELRRLDMTRKVAAWLAALGAGATSGFSGTSGPLKGVALRSLSLDRMHLVGAASLVSLAGDVAKSFTFVTGGLVDESATFLVAALPLMPVATWLGRRINQELGEVAYASLFWVVMTGYAVRALVA